MPSPKKPRMQETKSCKSSQDGGHSTPPKLMANVPKSYSYMRSTQKDEKAGKGKGLAIEVGEEDSDDDVGLQKGEMIIPGSNMLNVGETSFEVDNVKNNRKLWAMECNNVHSVVINKYGTNMI